MHKDEGRKEARERARRERETFSTKSINKKVGKVGGVIYTYRGCVMCTIYEKGAEEKARGQQRLRRGRGQEDGAATAAVAHPSSSSYDIDNSFAEREAEAVFPMHILHKRARYSPPRFPSARGHVLSREGERTAIFIEARIHRGVAHVKL